VVFVLGRDRRPNCAREPVAMIVAASRHRRGSRPLAGPIRPDTPVSCAERSSSYRLRLSARRARTDGEDHVDLEASIRDVAYRTRRAARPSPNPRRRTPGRLRRRRQPGATSRGGRAGRAARAMAGEPIGKGASTSRSGCWRRGSKSGRQGRHRLRFHPARSH